MNLTTVVVGYSNEIELTSVLLWEHADRIRSGELWELAPALVLCEDNPTEATVRAELELIRGAAATEAERANLLAISLRIAGRDFPRPILEGIFREALPMVQGATIIDDWIAEGEARGEARGTAAEARRIALRLLTARFGELPARVRDRVAAAEPEWCEELVVRAARAESLDEIDW